jgi:hypothetical protein
VKRKRNKLVFGTIHVPGYPPTKITNAAVAAFLAGQEAEIARLNRELAELQPRGRILLPGGPLN